MTARPAGNGSSTALPQAGTLPATSSFDAAIYIHWPFCAAKCPYCDFNSHVRERIDQDRWRDGLLSEIDGFADRYPGLRPLSVFFGGGTPSLMPDETVAAVLAHLRTRWPHADWPALEVTLEANPTSVDAQRFRGYAHAGVNRLSMGIQALNDTDLKFLGRWHSVAEALRALDVARDNFKRISFDLIYARPGQSLAAWRRELGRALAFSPSHLSLYQLTIEEGTAFYQRHRRGEFTLPDEDQSHALFMETQSLCGSAGLPAYEISNHAAKGQESRHNLAYWRGDFYVGIGPGAHGRLPGDQPGAALAHSQVRRPEGWLDAVVADGIALFEATTVTPRDRFEEMLMMGLRLKGGIDLADLGQRTALGPQDWPVNRPALEAMIASGHLRREGSRLAATELGWPLINHLVTRLIV